jgi:hypothetical protein
MPTSSRVPVDSVQRLDSQTDPYEHQTVRHRIILEPILDLDRNLEIIDPEIQHREPLHISEEKPLMLGRNMTTKIHDTKISRRLATITVTYPDSDNSGVGKKPQIKILLYQCGALHKFCINGVKLLEEEYFLKDGDVIGLYGNRYKYKLRVYDASAIKVESDAQVLERSTQESVQQHQDACQEVERMSDDTKRPAKRKRVDIGLNSDKDCSTDSGDEKNDNDDDMLSSAKEESKHQAIITSARKHIMDEVTCTVCMEIIVKAHTVNPCGHIFCQGCIQKILPQVTIGSGYMTKSCPNCRKSMKSLSPLKSMDNLIWNMILRGDIFEEEEDLKEFMRRSGKKWGDLKKEEIECIFGRREVKMQSLREADEALEKSKKDKSLGGNKTVDLDSFIVGSMPAPRRGAVIRSSDFIRSVLLSNPPRRFFPIHNISSNPNNSGNATVQYEGSGSREDPIVL